MIHVFFHVPDDDDGTVRQKVGRQVLAIPRVGEEMVLDLTTPPAVYVVKRVRHTVLERTSRARIDVWVEKAEYLS